MKTGTTILISSGAIVVCIAGGIVLAAATNGGSSPSDSASTTSTGPEGGASSNTAHATTGAKSTTSPTTPTTGPSSTPGPKIPEGGGSATPAAIPTLPAPTRRPSIVPSPLPASATAAGRLAKGFPEGMSAAPHSSVTTSSLAEQGDHLQATFSASSTMAADDVLAYYLERFATYGLVSSSAPAVGGSTATAFTRDDDSITVSITPKKGGVDYVVFGALTAD